MTSRAPIVFALLAACTPLHPDDDPIDPGAKVVEITPVAPTTQTPKPFDPDACVPERTRSPSAPPHESLAIELRYDGAPMLEPGEPAPVVATMVNRSSSQSHTYVKPGDGSWAGWRPPGLAFEAEVEVAPDCWQPVQPARFARCGVFDQVWQDDLHTLAPKQSAAIDPLWGAASSMLDFSRPGRVRMRVVYVWDGGLSGKGDARSRDAKTPRRLRGVAPYEIVSNDVEFTVAAPLNLVVQPVGRTSNTAPVMLRDIVEVRLANVSDVARTLRWPTADTLKIEVRGDMTRRVIGTWEPGDEKSGFSIDAGSEITLVGPGRINSEMEFAFLEPLHGRVQLRATLRPYQARQQVRVVSDWIDLELD